VALARLSNGNLSLEAEGRVREQRPDFLKPARNRKQTLNYSVDVFLEVSPTPPPVFFVST
jgi:hypothetical protein